MRNSFSSRATAIFSGMTFLPVMWFCCTSVGKSLKIPTVIDMDLIHSISEERQQKRCQWDVVCDSECQNWLLKRSVRLQVECSRRLHVFNIAFFYLLSWHTAPLAPASPSGREGYSVYSCSLTYFFRCSPRSCTGDGRSTQYIRCKSAVEGEKRVRDWTCRICLCLWVWKGGDLFWMHSLWCFYSLSDCTLDWEPWLWFVVSVQHIVLY
jgi:hypothetical protein